MNSNWHGLTWNFMYNNGTSVIVCFVFSCMKLYGERLNYRYETRLRTCHYWSMYFAYISLKLRNVSSNYYLLRIAIVRVEYIILFVYFSHDIEDLSSKFIVFFNNVSVMYFDYIRKYIYWAFIINCTHEITCKCFVFVLWNNIYTEYFDISYWIPKWTIVTLTNIDH